MGRKEGATHRDIGEGGVGDLEREGLAGGIKPYH